MTDIERVLSEARKTIGVRERGGSNCGPEVESYLASVGLAPGSPWCAAWLHWVGRAALGTRWPLPRTGSCWELGGFAVGHSVRYVRPQVGDVFLLYFPRLGRFGHTGFVTGVAGDGSAYDTIEGNSNDEGSREGVEVCARVRTIGPQDRFIRWTELLK